MKTKILILCTGNSCRSQMAHGFLQSFDKRLEVKSGGTKPANRVNPTAVEVMSELDIDISHHVPQNVDNYKAQEWDYVITVCDNAKENCPVFSGKVKHLLHIGFEDPSEAVGTPEFIMNEYHRIRDEIRSRFHELYTEKILPELN